METVEKVKNRIFAFKTILIHFHHELRHFRRIDILFGGNGNGGNSGKRVKMPRPKSFPVQWQPTRDVGRGRRNIFIFFFWVENLVSTFPVELSGPPTTSFA
jgi:hypothetical protein